MIYSTAAQVTPLIEQGAPISTISYRTRSWELTSATSDSLDQVWIIFCDGRKRNLFKQEWLKLMSLHRHIRPTSVLPEEL